MKRFLLLLLVLTVFANTISSVAFASDEIKVFIDGKYIEFDVEPCIIDNRTMVPIRAIFEALGAKITWNPLGQTASAYSMNNIVSMTVGRNIITVNGEWVKMDTVPVIIDDRILAPARYVAESFGCSVSWDATLRTVYISRPETTIINYSFSSLPQFESVTGIKPLYKDTEIGSDGVLTHSYKYNLSYHQLNDQHMLEGYFHQLHRAGWKTDGKKYELPDENLAYYYFSKDDAEATVGIQVNSQNGDISLWIMYTSHI